MMLRPFPVFNTLTRPPGACCKQRWKLRNYGSKHYSRFSMLAMFIAPPQKEESSTHLKFNGSHLKSYFPKRKVIFQRSVFWGYVKLRVCISPSSNYQQASKETCANHNLRVENMLGCQIAKQKVRCTPEITQQAAFQKRNQNHAASRKSIQMHSTPKGYPKCSGLLNHHQFIGENPYHLNIGAMLLTNFPLKNQLLQGCSYFQHQLSRLVAPSQNKWHLCGSFARTDAANEFTQFDGHGGATGPAGDPTVPPRPGFSDSTRVSRGVVGGEVNHGFIQVTLFVGGTQPPSPFKKQRNHSSSLFVGGTLLHEMSVE